MSYTIQYNGVYYLQLYSTLYLQYALHNWQCRTTNYNRERHSAAALVFPLLYLNVRGNSWRAKDQRVNFALFAADSIKYWRGLWSEYTVTWVPNIQLLHFFRATNTAYASRSIVDQAICAWLNLVLENALGNSVPSSPVWVKTADTAIGKLASTNKLNGLAKSAIYKGCTAALQSKRFNSLKLCCRNSPEGILPEYFLDVNSVSGWATFAKSWLHRWNGVTYLWSQYDRHFVGQHRSTVRS